MSNSLFDWPASLDRFIRFDAARAEEVNAALDYASSGFDTVEVKTNAAIKIPDGETAIALGDVASRKGKVVSFNAITGAVETSITGDQVALAQTYAQDAEAQKNLAIAQVGLATDQADIATAQAVIATGKAADAAISAAAASAAALSNLTARSFHYFTM
jgi:hypothetical protein